ncbi:MAG: hypothetical protein ACI9KE_006481 [Polyangiales bacterium]|jgi:hypothetical protein
MESICKGPKHHFFGLGNVLVMYYIAAPPADALREREAWVKRALKRHSKLALLVVVDKHATGLLPDAEFRAVSREQALKYSESIACSAVVLETDSVWSGLLRSFLRGLSFVVRATIQVRYFSSVADAVPFALEASESTVDAQELKAAVESVRMKPPPE